MTHRPSESITPCRRLVGSTLWFLLGTEAHAADLERSASERFPGEEQHSDDRHDPETDPPDTEQDSGTEEKEFSRVSLGARGFAGALVEGEEFNLVFGGGLLLGVPLWKRLELEGSVMLASKGEPPAFFIVEGIFKWVFEQESHLAPHVIFGPLVSLDLTDPVEVSGGLIFGGGVTYWVRPRFGATLDLSYRLLVGSEVSHAGTGAVGVVFRPF